MAVGILKRDKLIGVDLAKKDLIKQMRLKN